VPGEDGSADRLARAFRAAGWRVAVDACDINHILEVGGRSFAAYWESRPGQLRTTLKRKAKKVETQVLTQFDPAVWADYEAIYAASWKPAEDQPAMLRALAQEEGAAGRLRLGVARAEGLAVAAQCWTVENGVAYIHKLAHLESHKPLSAGTTLSAALFQHVIDADKVEAQRPPPPTTPPPPPDGFSDGYDLFGFICNEAFNPSSPTLKDGTSMGSGTGTWYTMIWPSAKGFSVMRWRVWISVASWVRVVVFTPAVRSKNRRMFTALTVSSEPWSMTFRTSFGPMTEAVT
jgi:hypothetical protein